MSSGRSFAVGSRRGGRLAEIAEPFKQTPMYEIYREIAPRVEDWPILVTQLTGLLKLGYDWTDEVRALSMPVMIVAGDADGLPPRHAVELFELLGGGRRDAVWIVPG
jgi:fermentation-respiration switch protein FrsA (DUF1100 family)